MRLEREVRSYRASPGVRGPLLWLKIIRDNSHVFWANQGSFAYSRYCCQRKCFMSEDFTRLLFKFIFKITAQNGTNDLRKCCVTLKLICYWFVSQIPMSYTALNLQMYILNPEPLTEMHAGGLWVSGVRSS